MLRNILAVCGLLALAACAPPAPAGTITIENAHIAAPPPGAAVAAAYFTLRNDGPADRLVAASSPAAAAAELHATQSDAGMMSMHHMEGVDLPAGGVVAFAPGGQHIMLTGLTQPLLAGASQPITLSFAHAQPITVNFTVQAP
ncbi:MAG TPA: copper chaperone PCu(A)C [Caulobacterales bacterium]|jgi:copper(I)-binding protein|nr:copper chaperone PCu(A)C [Caulobacterales bacterium]